MALDTVSMVDVHLLGTNGCCILSGRQLLLVSTSAGDFWDAIKPLVPLSTLVSTLTHLLHWHITVDAYVISFVCRAHGTRCPLKQVVENSGAFLVEGEFTVILVINCEHHRIQLNLILVVSGHEEAHTDGVFVDIWCIKHTLQQHYVGAVAG